MILQERRAVRRLDGLTGRQLLGCVAAILLLALPVPAAFGIVVNRARVARASADVQAIAAAIALLPRTTPDAMPEVPPGAAARSNGRLDLIVGPGNLPRQGDGTEWISGKTGSLVERLGQRLRPGVGSDPWGNRYTVNVRGFDDRSMPSAPAGTGAAIWVLSAGPNGIIETPFTQRADRARLGGDDVGARVR